MRKHLLFTLSILLLFVLVGCTSKHKITLITNCPEVINSVHYKAGETLSLPTPTYQGYTFEGWYLDQELTEPFTETRMPGHDLTLYAKWSSKVYTIQFVMNGGESIASITESVGTTLLLPTPVKEGFTFMGWYTDQELANEFTETIMPDNNLTLYAKWTDNPTFITFATNKGESIETIVVEGSTSLTLPSPTRFGYTFIGWFRDSNLSTPFTDSIAPEDDFTLYAKWGFSGSEGFDLRLEDNTYKIIGYTGTDKIVRIPSHYNDIPITSMSIYAFSENTNIESIVFEEDSQIKNISNLINMPNLETIYFHSNVDYIGSISNTPSLKEIYVDPDNEDYSSIDGVLIDDDYYSIKKYPENKADKTYTVPNHIDKIGVHAFSHNLHLENIIFPKGLTYILDSAFYKTENLKTITFDENNNLFINKFAFSFTSLTEVSIPNNTKFIDSEAFAYTEKLTRFHVNEDNTAYKTIDGVLFNKSVSKLILYPEGKIDTNYAIPNTVETIRFNAFKNAQHLTEVSIPNSVSTIEGNAFANTPNLKTVIFDEGCTLSTIPYNIFKDAISLESIIIPNSVIEIENYAFHNAVNLHTVTFLEGSQLNKIESGAFYGATSLKEITIPSSVTNLGINFANYSMEKIIVDENNQTYSSIDGVLYNKEQSTIIVYPKGKTNETLTIPNTVTEIQSSTFFNNKYLQSVFIPNSVTSIGNRAFFDNENLKTVIFEEGSNLEVIGDNAFSDNTNLTSISIPSSVTAIGKGAFSHCSNLVAVTIESDSQLTFIGSEAFNEAHSLTSIFIPQFVHTIEDKAFHNTSDLFEIQVDDNNQYYSSIDGVLYNKDHTILIKYPEAKTDTTFTIVDTLVSIENGGLSYVPHLESINVLENHIHFSSIDGVLYDKNQNILIKYPDGKKDTVYVIPDTLSSFDTTYNLHNKYLTDLIVNEENKYFKSIDGVLYNKALNILIKYPEGKSNAEFTIISSIEIINEYAFYNNIHLKHLIFEERSTRIEIYYHSIYDVHHISKLTLYVENPSHISSIIEIFRKLAYESLTCDIYVPQSLYDEYVAYFKDVSDQVININQE